MNSVDEAKLIDGRSIATAILARAAANVQRISTETGGQVPALATVIVGDDPASHTYVRMKRKRCEEAGMLSIRVELPQGTTTPQLLDAIHKLAASQTVHGILLQHPVPAPIDRRAAFEAIPIEKDVDGVTSAALGRLLLGMPSLAPCTPRGIMMLLEEHDVDLDGAEATVIGRSPILGRPMASMLINKHATVTLCHSRTRSLSNLVRRADVVIAAVGKPRYVKGTWIKPGAVVIDAGYNPGNIGDVDFDSAIKRASLITPVPGGVGPMTIAVLIEQTVQAAADQLGVSLGTSGGADKSRVG
ncbi:MAG: bifunctional 5,10-methylenetetrahydrofolate dehydrogenase/5,10-methenyltetrahydrofolate cyclohydrolase [Planctomycetes bacterium]|nr:bifunctional 5,10-methylenetetrahydrofolate dehydrogenase/5,10-methenyltetrahydrofolate cyclohydrolase [Planctomycetota bacterium]NOG53738.1 bifunctional 5,10-methylenetetrahydrofolate dehydrogenase/5,10-methenyltetrahydrofolate cyclohydrolase [Planctomycetota bacterium]